MSNMASSIGEKAKAIAEEDIQKVKILASDAARSGAYLYPFKGIVYFVRHKELWKPLASKLFPTLTTATAITATMFIFTYLPQAAALTLVNGPLAIVTTVALVLSESSTITNVVARSMFIDEALVDTFDATLITKSLTPLVAEGRTIKSGTSDAVARLGKLVKRPFQRFSPAAIIRYFMYLPLNLIPVVGTILFLFLQAKRFGPNAHARYFQLKNLSASEKEKWIARRKAAYTSFGLPAQLLEMVPFVGIFFAFTNATGAALWAADLEAEHAIEKEVVKP